MYFNLQDHMETLGEGEERLTNSHFHNKPAYQDPQPNLVKGAKRSKVSVRLFKIEDLVRLFLNLNRS